MTKVLIEDTVKYIDTVISDITQKYEFVSSINEDYDIRPLALRAIKHVRVLKEVLKLKNRITDVIADAAAMRADDIYLNFISTINSLSVGKALERVVEKDIGKEEEVELRLKFDALMEESKNICDYFHESSKKIYLNEINDYQYWFNPIDRDFSQQLYEQALCNYSNQLRSYSNCIKTGGTSLQQLHRENTKRALTRFATEIRWKYSYELPVTERVRRTNILAILELLSDIAVETSSERPEVYEAIVSYAEEVCTSELKDIFLIRTDDEGSSSFSLDEKFELICGIVFKLISPKGDEEDLTEISKKMSSHLGRLTRGYKNCPLKFRYRKNIYYRSAGLLLLDALFEHNFNKKLSSSFN